MKVIWTAVNKEDIAGMLVETTPNAVLRGLVTDEPVQIAPAEEQDLALWKPH